MSTEPLRKLLFHETWWLDAATAGEWRETTVSSDGKVVARLPFAVRRKLGLVRLRMPAFTHVLGPDVPRLDGKPQTEMSRRTTLVKKLIDQLPRHHECKLIFDSPEDGLAFQSRGFAVRAQYTFRVGAPTDPEAPWKAMNYRLRQNIRRAEEKFELGALDDAEEFVRFYDDNVKSRGWLNTQYLENFPALFHAVRLRGAGEVLCARWPDRTPTAMIFTAWDAGTTYYLLSTRAGHAGDNGSVCLLVWQAIRRAHERGLAFDFDGVSTSGTAKFYAQFGGDLHTRFVAYRSSALFEGLAAARSWLTRSSDEDEKTFV